MPSAQVCPALDRIELAAQRKVAALPPAGANGLTGTVAVPPELHEAMLPHESVEVSAPGCQLEDMAKRAEEGVAVLRRAQELVIAQNAVVLSHHPWGCRLVQRALDEADGDGARVAMVGALRGHVWEAVLCPHASQVLEKYISLVGAADCRFIVDELLPQGRVCSAARNRFGCRVIQQLLERLQGDAAAAMVDQLLAEGAALSLHRFGTLVVQRVLEHGAADQRHRAALQLEPNVARLSRSGDACAALGAALEHCAARDREALVRALIGSPGAVAAMAQRRRGFAGAISVLKRARGAELRAAARQLLEHEPALQANRYGRAVLCALGRLLLDAAAVKDA